MTPLAELCAGGPLALRSDRGVSDPIATLRGYGIVFHSLSEDLGGWREIIHPRAMERTFRERRDLRAYVDHNPERIIGRLSAGTLRAKPDAHGLAVEIDLPATTVGFDLEQSVRRLDVTGMSFAFRVMPDGDEWTRRNGETVRTVVDCLIFEISAVAVPAYSETTVAVRGLHQERRSGPHDLVTTAAREYGRAETQRTADLVTAEFERLALRHGQEIAARVTLTPIRDKSGRTVGLRAHEGGGTTEHRAPTRLADVLRQQAAREDAARRQAVAGLAPLRRQTLARMDRYRRDDARGAGR